MTNVYDHPPFGIDDERLVRQWTDTMLRALGGTMMRRKVSRAFTPRMMAVWEQRIRDIAEELVDAMAAAIGDETIPVGANVLPLIASANRDPRHWDDPDTFRLDRTPNDHLAFGTGIHHCIGQALARLEGRVAIETVFRRIPDLRVAGEPERISSPVLRGLRSLPVS